VNQPPVNRELELKTFLEKVAATPSPNKGGRRGRLIFAMDATLSREPTWDQACQIQGEMFLETAAIGGLDVQMVYFRGFSECRHSKWVSSPDALLKLMTGVRCRGGHTQIGRVMRNAISEARAAKVDAMVFVGDCMEESADDLCTLAGELGLLGVPTFVFQEGHDPTAERTFREVARLTKGAYCRFDANSAHQLRDLLKAVAVYAAGGAPALADLGHRLGGEVALLANRLNPDSAR
jgi:hypothetical protein